MKKFNTITKLLMVLISISFGNLVFGQLTGTKNIPGDYPTLAAAIADLNAVGVGAGGVTINLTASNPETAPLGGYVITATGTSADPIIIQGNGNIITAPTPQASGVLHDAIFEIDGADYVTIDNFSMEENILNTTTTAGSNNMTEWGVAVLYATTTNGAKNVTIKNCVIDLNRTYQNTFGIYSNSTHAATTPTTSATATGVDGGNSGLTIIKNTITDVNHGIVIVGPTAAADHNLIATIGGSAINGNTITNFGTTGTFSGYANVSGTINGVLVRNTKDIDISYNSISSSDGGVTAGTINGIQIPAFSNAPTGAFTTNISNNILSVKSGSATGAINGINNPSGSASANSTININNNDFNNFGHTVAGTANIQFILNAGTHLNQNINNNTFTNINVNTIGNVTFISNNVTLPAGGVQNVNNNSIVTAFNKTGAGGTVTLFTTNASSPAGTTVSNSGNNFSNITVTGATILMGWSNTDGGGPTKTIQNNTFNNWTGGTSVITVMNLSYSAIGSIVTGNTITNITGQAAITAMAIGTSSAYNVYSNTINTISSTGTGGAVIGISITSGSNNIYSHQIYALSSTGAAAVSGISNSGATLNSIYKNKIYDISSSNAGGSVNGLLISSGSAVYVSNNYISDIKAPTLNAGNSLNGINITGGTTIGLYYNTVYLNATSSGALFGTNAVSVSTTPTVDMRNNIFVNASTPNGASGYSVAYRRSGTTLTSYASTSNNNCFYAGTPGVNNVIFYDGTNFDQTFADYKTRVSSRDAASFSENVTFIGAPTNLHLNATVPTQCESGATVMTSPIMITTDYDGDVRNATTPDIGADEGTFTPLDLTAPTISYTALANTSSNGNRSLAVTITDASGVGTGANQPVLYWQINSGAYTGPVAPISTVGSIYTFSFGAGVIAADVVNYFVVAQDVNGNVISYPSAGATVAANPPTCSVAPTTPSSYTIVGSICGTKTVGASGDYPTLTAALTDFSTKEMTCPVVLVLTDADYSVGETFPITINQLAGSSATNTLTIRPAFGNTATISGSFAGGLVVLNGADYIIIDGSNNGTNTRDLNIVNTATAGTIAGIQIKSLGTGAGATNNIIKNCNISLGSNSLITGYAISIGGNIAIAGDDNDNNTVQNNNITKAYYGIWAKANATGVNDNLNIINNTIGSDNATDYITKYGINLNYADGALISANNIKNIISTNNNLFGIAIEAGVANSIISKNNINNIKYTGSGGYGGKGIDFTGAGISNVQVDNNVIYSILGDGWSNFATDANVGIKVNAGNNLKIYYNTVFLSGSANRATATVSAAFYAITGLTNLDLRNNIFVNEINNASSASAKAYAIYSASANTAYSQINYNNYFGGGTQGVFGYLGSDQTNLAAWQLATGKDANSVNIAPSFTSTSDFHLTNCDLNIGTSIGSVTTDIEGTTRSITTPTAGAYEYIAPAFTATYNPSDGATGVSVGSTIDITFSDGARKTDNSAIDASVVTFVNVTDGNTAVPFTISYVANVLTITPDAALLGFKTYKITLAGVESVCDVALTGGNSTTFTTGTADFTAPTYVSSSVENAAPANVVVVFDENIAATSYAGFTVMVDAVAATISGYSVSGSSMTLTLSAPVTTHQVVTIQYNDALGTVTDVSTNPLASFGPNSVTNNTQSSEKDFLTFAFLQVNNPSLTGDVNGTISANGVDFVLPNGTNLSNLIATFTTSDYSQGASIGATLQTSGVTANDFTTAKIYTVKAEDGTTKNYTVKVNLLYGFPFTETFEGTLWSQTQVAVGTGGSGSDISWAKNTWSGAWSPAGHGQPTTPAGAYEGSSVAWYDDYNAKLGQIDRLESPLIDLSSAVLPCVDFYWALNTSSSVVTKLVASNDGGATWNEIQTLTKPGLAWTNVKINLPAMYKVSNAKVGIQVLATWGNNDVWVDKFVIRELSSNADLATLTTSDGTLSPVFDAATNNYEVDLPTTAVAVPTIGATKADVNATLTLTQATSLTGLISDRTANAHVVAENGIATKDYNVLYNKAEFNVNNTNYNYGNVSISSSNSHTFIVSNIGTGHLNIESVTITGTNADQFSLTDLNIYPVAISTIDDLEFDVEFAPTSAGYKEATINIKEVGNATVFTATIAGYVMSNENDITAFDIATQVSSVINDVNHTVTVTMPYGEALSNLTPIISVSNAASIDPLGGVAQDFTSPVDYTVTAEDGTDQIWTVTVDNELNDENEIISFDIVGQIFSNIEALNHEVTITMPFGTDVTNLIPTIVVSADATVSPNDGIAQNFTLPVTYTVTAQNGTPQDWTVTVNVEDNNANEILSFTIPTQTSSDIDAINHTVTVIMPPVGTNLANLTPDVVVSTNATVNPNTGVAQDFTSPVTYTVTAQNGTPQDWVVTVKIVPVAGTLAFKTTDMPTTTNVDPVNNIYDLGNLSGCTELEFVLIAIADDDLNTTSTFDVFRNGESTRFGYMAYAPMFSAWAFMPEVTPFNWQNGTNNLVTTFIDNGMNELEITVTFNFIPCTESDITAFSFAEQTGPATIDATNHTIDIEVANGTPINNLVATFSLSPFASAAIGGTAQISGTTVNDFTSAVIYTVTAQDVAVSQDWTVNVSIAESRSELSKGKINIYPNPAKDLLFVEINNYDANTSVSLIAANGTVLSHEQATNKLNTINVSQLPTGVYYVKIVSAKETIVKKIVVE